jgi:hypothetical protein
MQWIINVNICSRPWIWSLYFLVYRPWITAVEGGMDCLLLNDPILDVVLFLLVIVCARSWSLRECLPSVWSLTLMLPKLSPLCLGHE